MSGAQPKAAKIAGAVSITAEVDLSRIETRHRQGWVDRVSADLEEVLQLAKESVADKNQYLHRLPRQYCRSADLSWRSAVPGRSAFPTRPPAMWFMTADIAHRG